MAKKMRDLKFLVIGAGSRGNAYARAIPTTTASIYAVAEPDTYKRRLFGQCYIWGQDEPNEGQEFADWQEWLEYEKNRRTSSHLKNDDGVDGLLICTLDETHIQILRGLEEAHLQDIHVLCEKPLALSLDDCLAVYASRRSSPSIFSIGHVLRYAPHNLLLRRLLREERVIGDIISIEHTEPVGFWHFAHSYVRGNWRKTSSAGDGSLLTKSCHDLDFIMWLVDESASQREVSGTAQQTTSLRTVSSSGRLTQFHRGRKPPTAGTATNCLSCPIERECIYSAARIYRDQHLAQGKRGWPVKIVCPDIEGYSSTDTSAENYLLSRLCEDYDSSLDPELISSRPWYGRCVWECDNDVCDDQVVTLAWNDTGNTQSGNKGGKTAIFHLIAHTQEKCERRGRVYGKRGEVTYDSKKISIHSFETRETSVTEVPRMPPEEEKAHGGGDYGLVRAFVSAVDAVLNHGWEIERAQREFVGCSMEDIIRSHAVVFAAEEARREEKTVKWEHWWKTKLGDAGVRQHL